MIIDGNGVIFNSVLPEKDVDGFCDFVEEGTNIRPWIVGSVLEMVD